MNKSIAAAAVAAGALIAGLGFAGFNTAQSQNTADAFSTKEQAAIEAIVAEYLRENPDVLIDALNAYAERERADDESRRVDALSGHLNFLVSDEDGFATGAGDDAKVAVVEFFDYHCGFCKRANGLVRDLTKDDDAVKVVFRELPILKEESRMAARFALAARAQDAYLDLHFALMGETGTLTEERVLKVAKKAGLDVDQLKADAEGAALKTALERNYEVARDIGVDGTPGFIVASLDGQYINLIPGFRPEAVIEAIEEAKTGKQAIVVPPAM